MKWRLNIFVEAMLPQNYGLNQIITNYRVVEKDSSATVVWVEKCRTMCYEHIKFKKQFKSVGKQYGIDSEVWSIVLWHKL